MHVDDFVEDYGSNQRYARWFFLLARLPAALRADFAEFISRYPLFCTWQGQRYRVTGASRMGDVWLSKIHSRDSGYDERVDLGECSDWSDKP